MIKVTVSAILALWLSGCALPPVVSVASLVLDGISYVATEKSVNDHVLSEVTQSDCAMWRVVKGDLVCHDYTDDEQGLLATLADAMETEVETPDATDTAVANARATVQPAGQLSAVGPILISDATPDL